MVALEKSLIEAFNASEKKEISFKSVRNASMQRFKQEGFPTIQNEEWKYTNLLPLLKKEYQTHTSKGHLNKNDLKEFLLTNTDSYKLVFVNGLLSEELSTLKNNQFSIASLKQNHLPDIIKKYWNTCLPKETDALVAINTALSEEGAFIYVPKNTIVDKPIQIVYATNSNEQNIFTQTRALIVVEDNAQVQITERHQNISQNFVFTNALTEIITQTNAVVDFYKIQNDHLHSSLIDNTWVKQFKNSNCTVDTFSFGSKLTRNNLNFILA